jgi:hypothetical protein
VPRHPDNVLQVNLRIRKELHRKLKIEAAQHRVSVNAEIALRLQDSFENLGSRRTLSDLSAEMKLSWMRHESYFIASELEREVFDALLQKKDPKDIVELLRKWLLQREIGRHLSLPGDWYVGGGGKVTIEDES